VPEIKVILGALFRVHAPSIDLEHSLVVITESEVHALAARSLEPMLVHKQKVFAYITHGNRLLVFVQPATLEESGVQVTGGTMEPDEVPEQAVMREAYEETGLDRLRPVRYLGSRDRDFRQYGDEPIHQEIHPSSIRPSDLHERAARAVGSLRAPSLRWLSGPDSLLPLLGAAA
jgi:8-oxo-dGTP pyrophosphatase MutT (NUDIX family)